MSLNAIALADTHFDVAFELIKVLLGIDQMKIVPRVRTFDDHHEKIATVVEITVAYRWFKLVAILLDPPHQVDRGLHCFYASLCRR